jgi:hypothetical protein
MKLRRFLPVSAFLLAAWAIPAGAARADSILYDGISLISGQQSFTESFSVTAPGTLSFSLSAIPWLDTVSNMSGYLSSASATIIPTTESDSPTSTFETYNIAAGTYYAHWAANASGVYNMGVVGMKLDFAPSAVGLPASLILMLSGLGLLFGWQSRKSPALASA